MLTPEEWDKFFELIDKMIKAPGTWPDKRQEVVREADRHDADFEEFTSWFEGL